MSDLRKNFLLFFDRPTEPIFVGKGKDKVMFRIPEHYYPERYKDMANFLSNAQSINTDRTIHIKDIILPDLSLPMELSRQEQFSLFVPKHSKMAGRLIDVLMTARDLEELQSICAYCQIHINTYMFIYCLSVAILHRSDTKGLKIPAFAETFPDKFLDRMVLGHAREVFSFMPDAAKIMPITIPTTSAASSKYSEQVMAYFREDIGINSHHWHWHLSYPNEATDRVIVNKDRRGELFYYMHHQILARYNVERMCNGLELTRPYNNFREPIVEGYFPKLDSVVASRTWVPRFDNVTVRDVDRPADHTAVKVSEMETYRDRILAAIESRSVLMPNGHQVPLNEETGIDILGNMMESTTISPNRSYYGDFHNDGHMLIGYVHDPDQRHLETYAVMGDTSTAMRDPVFYRWHAYLDYIFCLFKDNLTPYEHDELIFPDINVTSISIESEDGKYINNTINTLWERSTMNLSRGLDFVPRRRELRARFTHLQHEDFNYVIEVNNTSGKPQTGTVRIFLAPTVDQNREQLSFEVQRKLMIEMDKFTQALDPGVNTVLRNSLVSTVTIPFERMFCDQTSATKSAISDEDSFCGCGWPHHMLVPKGTAEGYPMELFVMISNWNEDNIEQDLVGSCNDAASYCGIRDRKYPDRRPMGFPFDRRAPAAVTLGDFLQPNMAVRNCTIKFTDRTRDRGQQ